MNTRHLHQKGVGGKAGFSLVEVTLAIGLVAFAFVAALGVLPVGLNALKASSDQTVEAQILRTIGGQVLVSEYGQFPTVLHFDYYGQPTTSASYYEVSLSTGAAVFPGSGRMNSATDGLTNVAVTITASPSPGVTLSSNRYNLLIANSGQ